MYAQKICEAGRLKVGAMVLLCSVSPRGSTGTVMRYLLQKPKLAWEIVRAFVFKEAATDLAICRRVFFSETAPSDSTVREYMEYFAVDSVVGLDTRTAPQQFPGKTSAGEDGRCSWLERLPPTLVVGADADLVVDNKAVEETAEFYDSQLVWVRGPHDIMLDPQGLSCRCLSSTPCTRFFLALCPALELGLARIGHQRRGVVWGASHRGDSGEEGRIQAHRVECLSRLTGN